MCDHWKDFLEGNEHDVSPFKSHTQKNACALQASLGQSIKDSITLKK